MTGTAALPVLMYHSVAPAGVLAPHGWLERISVDVNLFAATLEDWGRRGVTTVGVDDLRAYVGGRRPLPRRSIVLTLDDGYVDNWMALAPLLQRHGQRAIIFVSTDFIDPRPGLRPDLEAKPAADHWQGYLSADELRALTATGRVEIESHAASHTWEFVSPRIIDYYGPHWNIEHSRCRYRFLWLNANRRLKSEALRHLRRDAVSWGTPVYEYAPALVARRYTPDAELDRDIVERVQTEGGESFFAAADWRQRLDAQVAAHRAHHGERGHLESDADRRQRVLEELSGSRELLQHVTGREVRFLSPPQGGADGETLELARECGYDLVTASSAGRLRLNRPGQGSGWVYRCGTGYDLFGRGASAAVSLRSQRLVLSRCSGSRPAAMVTRAVGAWNRLRRRRG